MFNREKQKENMQKAVDKLVSQLSKQNILYEPTDGKMNNVSFKKDGKEVKISHHSFFRYSGISVITKQHPERPNESITQPVTDEMYMQIFMKPIIETLIDVA